VTGLKNNEFKGYGKYMSQPNLRHYPGIYLEWLRKNKKVLSV
jgi:hypothetical protein